MIQKFKISYVDKLPYKEEMDPGIIYISEKTWQASHLCPFGEPEEIVTPLIRGGWSYYVDKNHAATFFPEITSEINKITYSITKGYAIA